MVFVPLDVILRIQLFLLSVYVAYGICDAVARHIGSSLVLQEQTELKAAGRHAGRQAGR